MINELKKNKNFSKYQFKKFKSRLTLIKVIVSDKETYFVIKISKFIRYFSSEINTKMTQTNKYFSLKNLIIDKNKGGHFYKYFLKSKSGNLNYSALNSSNPHI